MEWSGLSELSESEIANPNLEMVSNWYPGRACKTDPNMELVNGWYPGRAYKTESRVLGQWPRLSQKNTTLGGCFHQSAPTKRPHHFNRLTSVPLLEGQRGGRDWILRNFIPASGKTLYFFSHFEDLISFLKVRYNWYIQHYVTSKCTTWIFLVWKQRWLAPFWNNKWQGHHTLRRFQAEGEEQSIAWERTRPSRPYLLKMLFFPWRLHAGSTWHALKGGSSGRCVFPNEFRWQTRSTWVPLSPTPKPSSEPGSGSCRAEGQASLCPGATTQYFRASLCWVALFKVTKWIRIPDCQEGHSNRNQQQGNIEKLHELFLKIEV